MKTKFIEFIGKIKNINLAYIKWVLFSVLAISFFISVSTCSSFKRKYENSYREYRDSVSTYINKYNEVYAMNNAYITDINTLKHENKELYDEVKSLRDNPILVVKTKTEYVRDTITIEPIMTIDTTNGDFSAIISYEDKWSSLSGRFAGNTRTGSSMFSIDNLRLDCSLTTDLVEKNGKLYFVSKSDNPYMRITDMDGYLLSPEKSKVLKKQFDKPWCVMVGFGGTTTIYDNRILFVPGVNLTIGYKILSF